MSPITTHVLDLTRGRPAAGVAVTLERQADDETWARIGAGSTDSNGRLQDFVEAGPLVAGTYRLTFDTGAYFEAAGIQAFHPRVDVIFDVRDAGEHHHVPLLLSPFGYSTYRGS